MAFPDPEQAVLTLTIGPVQAASRAIAATGTFWSRSSTSPGGCRKISRLSVRSRR